MQVSGESRLQKLLKLLENGSHETTRKVAAKHISEVAKLHPLQLPSILRKVHQFLGSKRWECRVAAAEAVGLVAEHFVHHAIHDLHKRTTSTGSKISSESPSSQLSELNLQTMLATGTTLLACGKQEYEHADKKLLSHQRRGLIEKMGADMGSLVSDADLMDETMSGEKGISEQASVSSLPLLSAREKNQLKRRARTGSRLESQNSLQSNVTIDGDAEESGDSHVLHKALSNTEELFEEDQKEWNNILHGDWPFRKFCDQACTEILDPCWEVRHGAALALREVLRSQAGAAGVCVKLAEEPSGWLVPGKSGQRQLNDMREDELLSSIAQNQKWIENCVRVLLYVLSMDRVGDYVSDQMVAPVRETAAQALGAAVQSLPVDTMKLVAGLLQQMVDCDLWEVRHGGLLGLKYLLAARSDISKEMLSMTLPSIKGGLEDGCDDVRAAAAEVMESVALQLAIESPQVVDFIRKMLWDILLDMDDLSSATTSVMQLLWQLYSQPGTFQTGSELVCLVPRLWPFFRHSLTSVRFASVKCLEQLLNASPRNAEWLEETLLEALILTFCNILLESREEVLAKSEEVWVLLLDRCSDQAILKVKNSPVVATFFHLASTPLGKALDGDRMRELHELVNCECSEVMSDSRPRKRPKLDDDVGGGGGGEEHIVGSQWAGNATQMRLSVTHALGRLSARLERCNVFVTEEVLRHLSSSSATSRLSACLVIWYWIQEKRERNEIRNEMGWWPVPKELVDKIYALLCGLPAAAPVPDAMEPYQEVSLHYTKLRREWSVMQSQCIATGLPVQNSYADCESLSLEKICELASLVPLNEAFPVLVGLQQQVFTTAGTLKTLQESLHMITTACAAASFVRCGSLPVKLNSVIQPLMRAIRKEGEHLLQSLLADALAELISICTNRKPSPAKMLRNICTMACSDPMEVPSPSSEAQGPCDSSDSGLMSVLSVGHGLDPKLPELGAARVTRCGAEAVLVALARRQRGRLFEDLPQLWEHITSGLNALIQLEGEGAEVATDNLVLGAIKSLQILKTVGAVVSSDVLPRIRELLPSVCKCSRYEQPAVRLAAARCSARLADAHTEELMPTLLGIVIPQLSSRATDVAREGGAVLVFHLVQCLKEKLVSYTVLLIVPLLARLCDSVKRTRLVSTSCFGTLVGLLPLAQGMDPPKGLSVPQREACMRDNLFLAQLLDSKKLDVYKPSVSIRASLRGYQQEGINWLAFLRRFGLHGVLADDMGLGKTLQAAVTIAASTADDLVLYEDSQKDEDKPLPSLVVCPATLVAHWSCEVDHFLEDSPLQTLQYVGTPAERGVLQAKVPEHNLLVTSYESLRADIDWFSGIQWNYCVLDEGHLIRNPGTRVSQACKRISARNRLILSGTPIQNNVLELWSLFDFLMPGFLGTQKDFMTKYGKAVQAARYSRKGSAEADAGLLALGSLHKQVMPFIMRRTKDEVLSDLPPKIIQDIYCDLSPLQKCLYDDFSKSQQFYFQASNELRTMMPNDSITSSKTHAFQSIQYLRRVCGHPLLALDWSLPEHRITVQNVLGPEISTWSDAMSGLQDTSHAPKLQALKELLEQCGIRGTQPVGGGIGNEAEDGCTPLHRILVFAQLKKLLDVVESSILVPARITFLRLDGDVDPRQRISIVQKFNSDPTIGVMLLTTKVGGLGLNLTSADTVVFLEHDWNPMNDLQAMDRVHRLGQERTVNVYRILTRGTLEEKIMCLQQFKMTIANSVVNKDNMSMDTMDTSKLLDLFAYTPNAGESASQQQASKLDSKPSGLKSLLEGIGELWDEKQYDEEFNVQNFMKKLAKGE